MAPLGAVRHRGFQSTLDLAHVVEDVSIHAANVVGWLFIFQSTWADRNRLGAVISIQRREISHDSRFEGHYFNPLNPYALPFRAGVSIRVWKIGIHT